MSDKSMRWICYTVSVDLISFDIFMFFRGDDDNDDDELFLWYGWPTKGVALFPAGTIARDPHHRESPARREQGLNLRITWVKA